MYQVYATRRYKKQLKKILEARPQVRNKIVVVLELLAEGVPLPQKNCNHQLKGSKRMYRECHILPDLLLVYEKKEKELIIHLVELGSHSDLF